MNKNSTNLFVLLLGVALGVIGGILFAPTKGVNARNMLTYKIRRSMKRLQTAFKAFSNASATMSSQAKAASQGVINETIGRAKQLLADANELAAELESP